MLPFGHVGLTAAAVKAYEHFEFKKFKSDNCIDYRIVVLGSMLPDIIDKTLVFLLYDYVVHDGRLIGHTLIFALTLTVIGLLLILRYKNANILLLGISTALHQLFDIMPMFPDIYFWPAAKGAFSLMPGVLSPPTQSMLPKSIAPLLSGVKKYLFQPDVFIPEILGAVIMVYFFIKLVVNRRLLQFIKKGRL